MFQAGRHVSFYCFRFRGLALTSARHVNTLQKYLLRQILASLLMTVAVFTFVILLGTALKEILPLLINGQVTFGGLVEAFALLIPFVWVFALPMGMLTATLLVFGRFSADQELTAARASGVSLLSLITPILVLNLGFCAISAAVNLEYAPRCRVAYNQLRYQLTTALLNVPLPEGRPITFFNDYIISIGKNRDQKLQDILVFHLQNETNVDYVLRAPRGQVEVDATNQQIVLRFFDAKLTSFSSDTPVSIGVFTVASDLNSSHRTNSEPDSITDMTFSELRAKLRDLERRVNLPPQIQNNSSAEATEKKKQLKRYRGDMLESIRVQIHRQVAFSFACFGFTLIGIPLGIRVHRRETNIGIAVALGLVLVYYSLIVVAQSFTNRPDLAPHLWMWVPNFLFQVIGAVLLWRANRGT